MRYRQLAFEYGDQDRGGHGAQQQGGGQVERLERDNEDERRSQQNAPQERSWRSAQRQGGSTGGLMHDPVHRVQNEVIRCGSR